MRLVRDSWLLLAVLSTAAGAVDVIGFLALGVHRTYPVSPCVTG